MRNVDLGWMRVFVEVGRLGSLSEAARVLHITQPAISYQIRRVEAEFGVALLRRRHRGVELTEAGRELHAILAADVARIDALAQRLRSAPRKKVFRLFTDYAFSGLWLIPRIHRFREEHPDFDIEVIATQSTDLAHLGPGDIAVVFATRESLGPGAVLLMPEVVTPVCAPALAASEAGIQEARLIHLDAPHPAPWFTWASYLDTLGVERDLLADWGNMRFNTYSLVIDAALAGQGVALGWRGLIDTHLARNMLTPIGPDLAMADRGYFMLQTAGGDEATELLREWLLAQTFPPVQGCTQEP